MAGEFTPKPPMTPSHLSICQQRARVGTQEPETEVWKHGRDSDGLPSTRAVRGLAKTRGLTAQI